eukprot:882848-Prymnesium_polylepis.1
MGAPRQRQARAHAAHSAHSAYGPALTRAPHVPKPATRVTLAPVCQPARRTTCTSVRTPTHLDHPPT